MTVSTNKSGGWTLNLGGGQERQFTTKTEAVQFGAREGRASGHAQLVIKAVTVASSRSAPTAPIHAARRAEAGSSPVCRQRRGGQYIDARSGADQRASMPPRAG
jgi:hypothetical protein